MTTTDQPAPVDRIAQECAEKCRNLPAPYNYAPIIAAAIAKAVEQQAQECLDMSIRAGMAEQELTRLQMELDATVCGEQHRQVVAERDTLRSEVEHIKAWANAKVEELDHYKRVLKSNGHSMELMAARIPTGQDVIDAVIEASAVSADSPGVLVWSANAPEQIEAALARIAALRDNSAKQ